MDRTPDGARSEGRASQRVFSGAVKTADMRHDVAVYRAACEAHARIEAAGGRVVRIRIDAELKGQVASEHYGGGCSPARAVAGTAAGVGVVSVAVGSMRCSRYKALTGGGEFELLNSDAITEAIRPFNPQGDFGARHVHTLPHRVIAPRSIQ